MEDVGVIERDRGSKDGREVQVSLTRQGRVLKQRAPAVPMSLLCMPGLPQAEQPGLLSSLSQLLEALHAANAKR